MGLINVNIHKNVAEVILDTSYESLHKHGYRSDNVRGVMKETLAAAVIIESNII